MKYVVTINATISDGSRISYKVYSDTKDLSRAFITKLIKKFYLKYPDIKSIRSIFIDSHKGVPFFSAILDINERIPNVKTTKRATETY